MESEKPSSFTERLIEYHLHLKLHEIRALEVEGAYPKDYANVECLHQYAVKYIRDIPPIYRFENPDTSFDIELPWITIQREYLCSVTWFFLLALHRPYIFSIPRSRTEVIKAGIGILSAQERGFAHSKAHHYKLFTLAFLTVEAAVSILAVLIGYPTMNDELALEAFRHTETAILRLNAIFYQNALAGAGARLIQTLFDRAGTVRGKVPPHVGPDSMSTSGPVQSINGMDIQPKGIMTHPVLSHVPVLQAVGPRTPTSVPSLQETPISSYTSSASSEKLSQDYVSNFVNNRYDATNLDLDFIGEGFLPTADLLYGDLVTLQDRELMMLQYSDPPENALGSDMMLGGVETQPFLESSTSWDYISQAPGMFERV